jgi:hypothetical protein
MLDKYITFFKAHERVLIVALVLVFGAHCFIHWVDASAKTANTKASIAIEQQANVDAATKALAAQSAAAQAQFAQQLQAEQSQIATLMVAITQRDAAAKTQIAKVTAPTTPTQAIVDLSTEYTLPVAVTLTPDGADVPTQDLQLFTATKIEDVTAQADLKSTQDMLTGSQGALSTCDDTVNTLHDQIAQDAVDLKAHDNASALELKKAKDDARKGKLKWFWYGLVTGFIGRSAIK